MLESFQAVLSSLLTPLIVKQVDCIPFPEQDGLQHWPDRLTAPLLAKDISRIQAHEMQKDDAAGLAPLDVAESVRKVRRKLEPCKSDALMNAGNRCNVAKI
jgi:hypothetical protein